MIEPTLVAEIKQEIGVNAVTSRVLDELSRRSGLLVDFLRYADGPRSRAKVYGVRVHNKRAYRCVGSAREVAAYMAGEVQP